MILNITMNWKHHRPGPKIIRQHTCRRMFHFLRGTVIATIMMAWGDEKALQEGILVGYLDGGRREKMEMDLCHFADERRDPVVFFANLLMQFRLALISNNHSISGLPTASYFIPDLLCLLTVVLFQRSLPSPTT